MSVTARLVLLCSLLSGLTTVSFGQVVGLAAAGAPAADPSYAQRPPVSVRSVPTGSPNSLIFDAVTGAVISGSSGNAVLTANTSATAQAGNDDLFSFSILSPINRPSTG